MEELKPSETRSCMSGEPPGVHFAVQSCNLHLRHVSAMRHIHPKFSSSQKGTARRGRRKEKQVWSRQIREDSRVGKLAGLPTLFDLHI